jgi:hypothetical protein
VGWTSLTPAGFSTCSAGTRRTSSATRGVGISPFTSQECCRRGSSACSLSTRSARSGRALAGVRRGDLPPDARVCARQACELDELTTAGAADDELRSNRCASSGRPTSRPGRSTADASAENREILIVTQGELDLSDCFSLAAGCGLTDLGTWAGSGSRRSVSPVTATAFRSSSSGGRTRTPRRRSMRCSRASFRRPRTRSRRGSPYGRQGCLRTGRSDSATTRMSSPESGSKTQPLPGEGSRRQVS